jgi:hypothetical protein
MAISVEYNVSAFEKRAMPGYCLAAGTAVAEVARISNVSETQTAEVILKLRTSPLSPQDKCNNLFFIYPAPFCYLQIQYFTEPLIPKVFMTQNKQ